MNCKNNLFNRSLHLFIVAVVLGIPFYLDSVPVPEVHATSPDWVSYGPNGGNILSMAVSPDYLNDQTVFVAPVGSGVYKSVDGGNVWGLTSEDSVSLRFITPSPNFTVDHTIFAGGGHNVFMRSVDGGQTWARIGNSISPTHVAFSPLFATDHTMFATDQNGGLFKSTDSGATWLNPTPVPDGGEGGLFVGPNYPSEPVIYVGGAQGMFKSIDDGQTWTRIADYTSFALSPDFANDQTILACCNNGGQAVRSTDGGLSWTATSAGGSLTFSPNYAVDGTMFSGDSSRILKSSDRGLTWAYLDIGFPPHYPTALTINQISLSPNYTQDQTVYAATGMGVMRSTDGGNSWSFTNDGIHRWGANRVVVVSPNYNSDHTVFDAGTGMFKSTDSGLTWQLISRGLIGQAFTAFALSPTYATDGTAMVGGFCGISPSYKTIDGGQTWQRMDSLPCPQFTQAATTAFSFSPGFNSDQTVFAATIIGVYKTTDGGNSWELASNGITNQSMFTVAVSPYFDQDQTVFAVGGGSLYRSTDSGQNWLLSNGLPSGLGKVAISPNYISDHTVVIPHSNGVYRSIDGGNSWSLISNQLTNITSIIFSPVYATDQSLYAISVNQGSFVSRDGGIIWTSLEDGKNFSSSIAVGIHANMADVFIGTDGASVIQRTLIQPTPPNTPPSVTVDNSSVAVNEGEVSANTGTYFDANISDSVTISPSVGTVTKTGTNSGTWSWSYPTTDGPAQSQTVIVTADDGHGGVATAPFSLTVNNVNPTVGAISGPGGPVQVNNPINVSANFTDPGVLDTHTAVWDWGDSNTSPGTVSETNGSGSVSDSHAYSSPGTYTVQLTVTDKDGESDSSSLVVEVTAQNQPPNCSAAAPSVSKIWPANHKFVLVDVLGVTDPEDDPVSITINSIFQDEPVINGDDNTSPDGQGVNTITAQVRAERAEGGNGRVYHLAFTAAAGNDGSCSGEVLVGVPPKKKDTPVDEGALYDSTVP